MMKDAMEGWWDPQGRPEGGSTSNTNQPGCWRLPRGGQRFAAGKWMGGDVAFKNRSDPCSGYGGSINLRA